MSAGGSATIAARLGECFAYEAADKAIPSLSYAVFDRRQVIAKGYFSGPGAAPPSDASRFRIGSITKTFTAIAAMQLVERGLLDLNADIRGHLPDFVPANPFGKTPMTLRQLLSHRSGLVREAAVGHYLDASGAPLRETIAALAPSTLKSPPGTYRYSNAGFAVVGALIEHAAGTSYADYVQANLFDRLGLDTAGIVATDAIRANLAPAMMWTIEAEHPAPVFDLGCAPAGNIYATLPNLVRYAQALLNGGAAVLPSQRLAEMWTPAADPSASSGYGLGFAVDQLDGVRSVGHGGVVYGYASQLTLLPEAGIGVVVLSILDFTNELIGRLSRYALRLALADGAVEIAAPRRLARPTAVQRAGIAGWYETEARDLAVEIREQGERLFVIEDGVPLEIRPLSATDFVLDGRIHGEATAHPFPQLRFPDPGVLVWKDRTWHMADIAFDPVPAGLLPHLGSYGPAFNVTWLLAFNGALFCLIEFFCPHRCEPLGGNRYLMQGGLYDDEILELGALDATGRAGIRVGEMFLARRMEE